MSSAPNMPTDTALARLSTNDLIEQCKLALAALNEAKNNGQNTTELAKAYQIFKPKLTAVCEIKVYVNRFLRPH